MRPLVKICGITNPIDAHAAYALGATFLGFVFAKSPREISVENAASILRHLPASVTTVGVFVNETLENILQTVNKTKITAVQLHGTESPDYISELKRALPHLLVIKAIGIGDEGVREDPNVFGECDCLLFDSVSARDAGAERSLVRWEKLLSLKMTVPFFIAGGLRPENVSELVRTLKPNGVDVSSGIESAPGKKDLIAMKSFFECLGEYHV